jgi:hypothetical protein
MGVTTFFLFLVVVGLVGGVSGKHVPMSECKFARATAYPIHRQGGVPYGTCGYGPVASSMASVFRNAYVCAPDDETYNGFPWAPPVSILTGGVGKACGECFQVTGPRGAIVVMVADICDKQCCDNCQGSLGGPLGGPDVQALDIETAVWTKVVNQTGGNVVVAYRKVSCEPDGKNVGFFFANEGTPQVTYFRMRVVNSIVGISNVEVKGSTSGKTGGKWTNLTRGWEGYFAWTGVGDIGVPFSVRVTSIYGNVITFAQQFGTGDLAPLVVHDSGSQFPLPGQGSYPDDPCEWPGPPDIIFDEYLHGLSVGGLKWRDWGGTSPNFEYSSNCHSGSKCIDLGKLAAWGMPQIGYQTPFPSDWFKGFSFWIRSSGEQAYNKLVLSWKYNGAKPTATSSTINLGALTTTWKLVNISFANMTNLPSEINVLQFQNGQSTTAPVNIFLDDIVLFGHTPSVTPEVDSSDSGSAASTSHMASSSGLAASSSSSQLDSVSISHTQHPSSSSSSSSSAHGPTTSSTLSASPPPVSALYATLVWLLIMLVLAR